MQELNDNLDWHKIADSVNEIEFSPNHIAVLEVNNKKICLGRFKEQLFAFAYKCPHAGGILADGWLDAQGNLVCPLHRYKYDIKNGRNVSGEGYYLKHWPVRVEENGVFVGMDKGSIWEKLFG